VVYCLVLDEPFSAFELGEREPLERGALIFGALYRGARGALARGALTCGALECVLLEREPDDRDPRCALPNEERQDSASVRTSHFEGRTLGSFL
jgi:hypothetical protein